MRNPMNSWEKSDSRFISDDGDYHNVIGDCFPCCPIDTEPFYMGSNDLDLMMKLRNAGTDHRKYMRMITVYLDITAPLYWWKEFDTYKVSTVANSCSTMHKIQEKEFTLDDFSCEHILQSSSISIDLYSASHCAPTCDGKIQWTPMMSLLSTICMLNVYRNYYLELSNIDEESFKKAPKAHGITDKSLADTRKLLWWQMIQLLPSSYNQKRTVMLNYEVLSNIYKSRRNHKLDEWHEFCHWIESLPYSEIIVDKEEE